MCGPASARSSRAPANGLPGCCGGEEVTGPVHDRELGERHDREVLHADAKQLGEVRKDPLDRRATRAVERAVAAVADAELEAEVMARDRARPVGEAELVRRER